MFGEKVKIIKIIIDYQVTSLQYLFNNCECIEPIQSQSENKQFNDKIW